MNSVTVSCPAALSFLYKKCPNRDLTQKGSIGIGCTVEPGITVTAKHTDKNIIVWNGKPIRIPTILSAIQMLTDRFVELSILSDLPLGYGFGLSGASTLASVYAINRLFNLKRSPEDLIKSAHIAEIINTTGLGTVGTLSTGGFLLKTASGIPVFANRLPFERKILYAILIGAMDTPGIINNSVQQEKINLAFDPIFLQLLNIQHPPTLNDIIDSSYKFEINAGIRMDPRVHDKIQTIIRMGNHATMALFGRVVITTMKPQSSPYPVKELTIVNRIVKIQHKRKGPLFN